MSLSSRRTPLRELRVEIVAALVIALVVTGLQFRDRPVVREPAPDAAADAPPPDVRRSNIAVVLPTASPATSLEQMAFDQSWLNAVESEIGRAEPVDAARLHRTALADVAWLIVPRKAAAELDAAQISGIGEWTSAGGVLLIEQPEGPWNDLIGVNPSGAGIRPTRRFTSFDGAVSRGDFREDILDTPLRTTLSPWQPANLSRGRDFRILLEVDGQPGIVAIPRGRGLILLILYHHGRATTLMRQGAPDNSFQLPSPTQPVPLWTLARSAVIDETMLSTHIPFVDLLDRNVLHLADAHRPVGRLWAYPGTHRGALLATHSESGVGSRAEYLNDWEYRNNARSSFFVQAAGLDPAALARVGRRGGDVHLEVVPAAHPDAPQHRWEIGRFSPIRRPMNMEAQRLRLVDDLHPYGPPLSFRVADGLRPVDWFDLWRWGQASGFVVEASMGPAPGPDEQAWGYLFGTGRPHRPLDRSGHRFQIFSLPYQSTDLSTGYSLGRLRRLAVDAAERYHTTVVIDWRADTMIDRPSWDVLEGWRNIFDLARSQDLWTPTLSEYVSFLFMRMRSEVQSSFAPLERRLTIEATVVGPERFDGDIATVSPSIAFPVRYEGRPIEQITLNGMDISASDLSMTGDRVLHILPVPPGDHRIEVRWTSPGAEAEIDGEPSHR